MQSLNHTNSGITELTDTQLDGIVGGSWLGDLFSAIGSAIATVGRFFFGGFQTGGSRF